MNRGIIYCNYNSIKEWISLTPEKLKALEPVFGSWYIESKLAEGKNSQFFKVYRERDNHRDYCGMKVLRFPANEQEISDVISSEKYTNVNDYIDALEQHVTNCLNTMMSLRAGKNVVRFDNYQILREQSCFYAVVLMELLTPLSDYVDFDNINSEQVVSLGVDISSALQSFRSVGVVHHGVRPENIYVDIQGNFKLGDFGYEIEGISSRREVSPYVAPELFRSDNEDIASDIYALGITMYKLLNDNRTPFLPDFPNPVTWSDRENAFQKSVRGEAFPKAKNADDNLWQIISKATDFNVYLRYGSPSLMGLDLQNYTPILAHQDEEITQEPVGIPISSPEEFNISDEYESGDSIGYEPFEVYDEDEELDSFPGESNKNKAAYFLIAGLVVVLCIIMALIFGVGKEKDDVTTTEETTTEYIETTTQVTTTETTTTEPTTTEVNTTEETTTEETTTEPTTTEPTTTEPTTTETTTTEPTTTETTTEPTTVPEPTVPTLVATDKNDGDESDDGRFYFSLQPCKVENVPVDEFFSDVALVSSVSFGENPISTGNAYVYQVTFEGVALVKVKAVVTLVENDKSFGGKNTCYITVEDGDFYYEPDTYQYYICLEEGAIESDDLISLPIQIKV